MPQYRSLAPLSLSEVDLRKRASVTSGNIFSPHFVWPRIRMKLFECFVFDIAALLFLLSHFALLCFCFVVWIDFGSVLFLC